MIKPIRKAAVLGSGVMGSGIAAHLANIGIPTLLFDLVPSELNEEEVAKGLTLHDKAVRNRMSENALKKLIKQKPAPLTLANNVSLIEAGNLEDDLQRLKEVDWIIEVVVENLQIKKQLFEGIDQFRKPGSIISSNTSGISVEAMAEGRSEDFQKHFLGTHFFNPPRYLKLLEIIPTKKTDQDVLSYMKTFGEDTLGKGVVVAKDTPNFIANRIGTYGLLIDHPRNEKRRIQHWRSRFCNRSYDWPPKERYVSNAGCCGTRYICSRCPKCLSAKWGAEKKMFETPNFMKEMLKKGWLGSKSGQGFFLKKGKEIMELDPETLDYIPRKKLITNSTEQSKHVKGLPNKLKNAYLW